MRSEEDCVVCPRCLASFQVKDFLPKQRKENKSQLEFLTEDVLPVLRGREAVLRSAHSEVHDEYLEDINEEEVQETKKEEGSPG